MQPRHVRSFALCVALLAAVLSPSTQAEALFRFSESAANSDPSDWRGLDEGQVFFRRLSHQEAGHNWTMKIGKGGQIYSIKMPELGELIAYQRNKFGQWVDEVFQHVIPMPPQITPARKVVDGDVHQAGYYMHSDLNKNEQILPRSVYSPMFAYRFDAATSSVSYSTWPQHAHLPRRYAENLALINQTISDLGEGVIEIGVEIEKWGGARFDGFNLPWTSFRPGTLPVHILSNPDGSYREATEQAFRDARGVRLKDGSTGGWIALVSSNAPEARGVGIVFGKGLQAAEDRGSYLRWGNYDGPELPGIDGTVATVRRSVNLDPGETLKYRYYLVIGTLADIQRQANKLESKVTMIKSTPTPEQAGRLAVCQGVGGTLKRTCAGGETPLFRTYGNSIPNAWPLFLLQDVRSGEYMVTNDPYELSFDPTDGTTKYVDLLGWAVSKGLGMAIDRCRHQPLSEALGTLPRRPLLGRNTSNLHVLRASDAACR